MIIICRIYDYDQDIAIFPVHKSSFRKPVRQNSVYTEYRV
jgi:hypothetical protein